MQAESRGRIHSQGCVLVTDGNERSALAVTRGLGRAGIPVVVGAESRSSLAGASRYCVRQWQYPSPLSDPEKFVSSLAEAVKQLNIMSIMPVTDATMQVVAAQRKVFGSSRTMGLPSLESYDLVSDKYRLCRLAAEQGVPIPPTIFVEQGVPPADTEALGGYPLVVKPGRSMVSVNGCWTKTSVHQVDNRDELDRLYRTIPYLREPSLIQKRIEGEGQGIFALCKSGDPVALFAHRRIREKPPAGGVSVLRESIELPKEMTDHAVRLLKKVGWQGVAMVEFKVESRTGIPNLMEINGRFWGSLQLAFDAGMNFPYLLYCMIGGEEISSLGRSYRVGTKSRWLLGDLDHLLLRLTRTNVELRLDSTAPSRWRCLMDFLKVFQKDLHYEVERLDDPGPALLEYRTWLAQLIGGRA